MLEMVVDIAMMTVEIMSMMVQFMIMLVEIIKMMVQIIVEMVDGYDENDGEDHHHVTMISTAEKMSRRKIRLVMMKYDFHTPSQPTILVRP